MSLTDISRVNRNNVGHQRSSLEISVFTIHGDAIKDTDRRLVHWLKLVHIYYIIFDIILDDSHPFFSVKLNGFDPSYIGCIFWGSLSLKEGKKDIKAMHGLYRTLINNMVLGVSKQFDLTLILKGVGYRAAVQGKELVLNLGYSHPITITPPPGIELKVEGNTNVIVSGIDKEVVGQISALIRSKRLPEPYKGKGVLYQGEIVKRKAGKSGK